MNVVWFRRDLRVHDNEALTKATQSTAPILCIYIDDPYYTSHPEYSQKRQAFIEQSLEVLNKNLQTVGLELTVLKGELKKIFELLLSPEYKMENLYLNYDCQCPYEKRRDDEVKKLLSGQGREVVYCNGDFLLQDPQLMDEWRDKYYSFMKTKMFEPGKGKLAKFELPPEFVYKPNPKQELKIFKGGEDHARESLDEFLSGNFKGYHWKLSRPWFASNGGTSRLSPFIAQGCISVREVYQRVNKVIGQLENEREIFALKSFKNRLRWRDSFRQRFYFSPWLAESNKYPEFNSVYNLNPLTVDKLKLYELWKNGRTGFPLVDASMRQLTEEGWMNFRMRAMCATFLCINCGVPWQYGAIHYMQQLVDGDIAIDHWQWQMQAGVTNPLIGAFRIYNPDKNLIEKDVDLKFIRRWIPELKGFDKEKILNSNGLGDYPARMLNWTQTKETNGKVISDLRNQVKERIIREAGQEFLEAVKSKEVVQKYYEGNNKRYQKLSSNEQQLKFELFT
jgi:deoxyribodipyrimidine photo-lyase